MERKGKPLSLSVKTDNHALFPPGLQGFIRWMGEVRAPASAPRADMTFGVHTLDAT